jgi:RND superfamily putative drug exporter
MPSSFTERLSRLSARRPWVVLAVWIIAVAITGLLATGIGDVLTTDFGTTVELESDKAQRLAQERIYGTLPSSELIVVRAHDLTVDDSAYEEYVVGLVRAANGLTESVQAAFSYYETRAESMVSADRSATLIPVVLEGPGDELEHQAKDLRDAARTASDDRFETFVVGEESIGVAFTEMAEADLQTAEIFGLPVALVVLAVVFGALVAAGIPIILALLAIVVSIGLIALLGQQFTLSIFVVNVATMIGLAVGIDYTLFIIERVRDERRAGFDLVEAIARAGATASRTVLFSGLTVIVALAGMLIIPDTIFRSISAGAIIVVIVTVVAALTLLPAVLSLLGDRVNALRVPFAGRRRGSEAEGGFWDRLVHAVMAYPVISVVASVAVLLAASAPYLRIELGFAGVTTMPRDSDMYRGFAILEEEFTGGLIEPTRIVVDAPDVRTQTIGVAITRLVAALAQDDSFGPALAEVGDAGNLAVLSTSIGGDATSDAAFDALHRLRDTYIPEAFAGVDAEVYVGGETAGSDDYFELIRQYTPIVFAFVLGLSFVVLLLVFRSLVVPVKAILMNLLSVGAAYGILVLVFQDGVGTDLLGFTRVDRIEAWVPLFLFAVLFGLSMDYHVFLLSRIRERYDQAHDNGESIAFGVRSTASIITGAALIMVAVFGGFAMGDLVMFQQMGFGLAVAVAIDATIVRSVLVPASMTLLGEANWYLPGWLSWLPDVRMEHGEADRETRRRESPAAGG